MLGKESHKPWDDEYGSPSCHRDVLYHDAMSRLVVSVNRFANEAEGFVVVCARHDKAISSEQALARIISPWDGVRGKTRFDRTRKFSEPQGESLTWHGGNAEHSDGDIDASCYQNLGGPLFSDGM